MKVYQIMARVSGGVTGTRQSPLKENGIIYRTSSKQEAEMKAENYNKTLNSPYSMVNFSYTVYEADDPYYDQL